MASINRELTPCRSFLCAVYDKTDLNFGKCRCGYKKAEHKESIQMEERLERFNSMSEKERDDEYKKMVEDREKKKYYEERDWVLKYGFDSWDRKQKRK